MANLQTPYCVTGVAGADLRNHANKFVSMDANYRLVPCITPTSPVTAGGPIGVCYSNVGSLQGMAYAIGGNTDVICAATIAPGQFVTSNASAMAIPCLSGGVAIAQAHEWGRPAGLARVEMCTPFRMALV